MLTLHIITEQRSFSLLRESGIFLTLAKILKGNPRCAVKAAQVLSEIAKNGKLYSCVTTRHSTLALFPLFSFVSWLLAIGLAVTIVLFQHGKKKKKYATSPSPLPTQRK